MLLLPKISFPNVLKIMVLFLSIFLTALSFFCDNSSNNRREHTLAGGDEASACSFLLGFLSPQLLQMSGGVTILIFCCFPQLALDVNPEGDPAHGYPTWLADKVEAENTRARVAHKARFEERKKRIMNMKKKRERNQIP